MGSIEGLALYDRLVQLREDFVLIAGSLTIFDLLLNVHLGSILINHCLFDAHCGHDTNLGLIL